ncbi:hypothetical protein HEK616_82010 (plasmid) [Streptomyces nigrescens]|uniref:Uncharacterized protein n=2 Tax=Streptomyces TaxID=1883 RepID=A0ABM8A840_STRNI|nr:hypothetical protein [Streptomyces nigrescens]MEE4420576.1 hypothetical protein [Streptomyces sp. DSM 41528]BDM74714.1 hypothetical protein HEK616_82010 [Streptomyces nigrescens]
MLVRFCADAIGCSYVVGERSDAVLIGVIVALSADLGLVNEYRAEKAVDTLRAKIRHRAVVLCDGRPQEVEVIGLVDSGWDHDQDAVCVEVS